ncbi:MAG: efflux RND transporter permease subunit [Candidatus Aminicenantia bacterium]
MKRFTDFIIRNPRKIILVFLVLLLFFAYWTKGLKVDADIMRALPKKIPERRYYDRISDIFPGKEAVFVALKFDKLFSLESVNSIYNLTKEIENIKGVWSVLSPTNAKNIKGTEEGLEITENLSAPITSEGKLEEFKEKFLSDELMSELLLGKDKETFLIMILISKTAVSTKVTEEVIKVCEGFKKKNPHIEKLLFAGKPVATYYMGKLIGPDMGKLFSIGILFIFAVFLFYFKSFRGIFIPLFVIIFSVIVPMGTLHLLGMPFSHSLEIMPIIVMTIAVAYSIYFLTSYYQNIKSFSDRKELVRFVILSLLTPISMSSLTDMAGFLGLNGSGVESLNELGIFTAIGIFTGLLASTFFIPSTLLILKIPEKSEKREAKFESFMENFGRKVVKGRGTLILITIILLLILLYGFTKLDFETTSIGNLPKKHPLREADRLINEQFSGSTVLEIVIEGKKEGAIKDIKILSAMDDLITYVKSLPHVGGTRGFSDIVKIMNMVLHGNKKNFKRIPEEIEYEEVIENGVKKLIEVRGQELSSQLIQLYEMSASPEDLASMVDTEYKMAKITVFLKTDRRTVLKETERLIKDFVKKRFSSLPVDVQTTGMAKLFIAINDRVVRGQALSILIAISVVFLITSIMFRSLFLGFFSIIPLFFSVFFNFGIMGLLKIKVSLETMIVSSISIGVGVDYAIQFIYALREKIRDGLDMTEAIPAVFSERGVAIFINAVVVALGFFTLFFSSLKQISYMGFLMAQAMITACVGAIILLPILFLQFTRKRRLL